MYNVVISELWVELGRISHLRSYCFSIILSSFRILTHAHPVVSAEHQRPGGGGVDFRPPPYDLENYAG